MIALVVGSVMAILGIGVTICIALFKLSAQYGGIGSMLADHDRRLGLIELIPAGATMQAVADHEKRITRLEVTQDGAARGTFHSPRVKTEHE
jgi:hypothetical protein